MAEPAWQEILRLRLVERNVYESAYSTIIDQYRRLAQQTKLLKERNASLLRAVASVKTSPNASNTPSTTVSVDDNPVRVAYIASLESQISSLRDELAAVYKTQGQNAQRLVSMNEALREKEELSRIDADSLRKAQDEISVLRRKADHHAEVMSEKDRTVQILHDEINTLQLELGQIEDRNATLTKDNAKLLQRWLDAKQAEANMMNEANQFYENMRSKKATMNTPNDTPDSHDASSTPPVTDVQLSGKAQLIDNNRSILTKDGIPSLATDMINLTPNG